jgi:hypothetical protein
LLDRIGPLPYNYIPILLIEFSGYKTAAKHKLKGLLKNLKSSNDRIKDIVLRYKRTSFIIMKTARLYSIRIVHLKITLLKHPTVKDTKKWRSIKCCSVEVSAKHDQILKYLTDDEVVQFLKNERLIRRKIL